MNDFLDNLANHQYEKMIEGIESESVEVEDDPKAKIKYIDSAFEMDIDLTIFLMMLPFDLDI